MRAIRVALTLSLLTLALAACNPAAKNGDAADGGKDEGSTSTSGATSGTDLERAQALVSGASRNQVRAVSTFAGPDTLVGIVTESNQGGAKQIVWSSPNFEVIMPSDAIDKTGTALNAKFLTSQEVYLGGEKLDAAIQDTGFIVGKKGPVVTAFMDPNCGYCNKFYDAITPLVNDGKVRVRYIMVGFLSPTSTARSVAILAAKSPAKALAEDEAKFAERHALTSPTSSGNAKLDKVVQENTALLGKAGAIATPALISCGKNGEITFSGGMPQDIAGFVDGLEKNPKFESCK